MLSMWRITSPLCAIHLHNSRITCLSFVIISWEIFFSRFSRDGERLYRLMLGDENVVYTSSEGGCLRVFLEAGESLVCLLRVGVSS